MKRTTILFAIIAILFSTTAWAKGPSAPNLDLGIKLGANFAKLDGKDWDGGYKASYLGGLFAGMRFKKVGVQVEVFYSQTSYSVDGKGFYSLYHTFYTNAKDSLKKGAFRVSYYNIPVLLQIKLFSSLWAQIGPQYSGVIAVKDADKLLTNAKTLFKSGDVSAVVGLEAKLPFHLVVGARYVLGLSSLNKTAVADGWQQRTIQAHIGYSFL